MSDISTISILIFSLFMLFIISIFSLFMLFIKKFVRFLLLGTGCPINIQLPKLKMLLVSLNFTHTHTRYSDT